MRLWNLNQIQKSPSKSFYTIQNERQLEASYIVPINNDEIIVSSGNNMNIYRYNTHTKSDFKIIKILQAHKDLVTHFELIQNQIDLLLSCSQDKECRLWRLSQGYCLKVFNDYNADILCLLSLSNKYFISAGNEIKIWDIEEEKCLKTFKTDEYIYYMVRMSAKKILCVGNSIKMLNI